MPESEPELLDSLIKRAQERAADRLERQMRDSQQIKSEEDAASQRRLEEMWIREHERQRAVAESKAEQQRQEQALVRYVLIAVAIAIIIVIALAVAMSLQAG